MADQVKPLRILVSEGSSTSGPRGHHDFWVWRAIMWKFAIRRPGAWRGTRAFVSQISPLSGAAHQSGRIFWRSSSKLLSRAGRFDVLLPTHEQGFLLARARQRLEGPGRPLRWPSFESYRTAHSKAGFSRLPRSIEVCRSPPTRIVTSVAGVARRHFAFRPSSRRRSAPASRGNLVRA